MWVLLPLVLPLKLLLLLPLQLLALEVLKAEQPFAATAAAGP